MYKIYIKRLIDLIISSLLLLLLSPFFIIVAILITTDSPGPIFFRQTRVGKDLENFIILKFRTMTHKKRKVGNKPLIGKADGVTKIGFILRRYKIDELPQLVHVLTGQMSLVGPRPSIPAQLDKMNEEQKKRYSIKPGLTGLAQVSGNIHLPWPERYKFDLLYTENVSLINDLKILTRTAFLIIKGEAKFKNLPLKIKIYE